ncbi:MAG: diphthine synthase [Nitrososphaeria archaeon]|nr:diphthine synthase [Nitrososphaeria archaeon]NDB51653.1 diphthine synthase [Nitrosopumilaceae archaeon]NDB88697.1 diphthine synthase [Nitrososphaerota archaeon]NDF30452.1 diphthine synthase [Nitrososphaeria archaeon]NDF35036.1 diphthine synthase [Nitrosopumilaceae archaeon]
MLWFVGLGIGGPDAISEKSRKIISESDIVYFEQFTSPMSEDQTKFLQQLTKGQFRLAPRWLVEDGKEILEVAKTNTVALLSYGDPYIATTHIELRVRAIQDGTKTDTIHASSAITSLIGECGLHFYKVGKTVTIMSGIPSATAYYTIFENLKLGNHTIVLLEWNQNKNFFLDPKDAISSLLEQEKEQARKVFSGETYGIVASRIGEANQKIIAGKFSALNVDFGAPPHTIIIPGIMHFTESDALKVLANCINPPEDNTPKIEKISAQMMKKYIPMVRRALDQITPHYKDSKEFASVLENADLYIKDAERFYSQGQDELAILSIGYADGLVDALRIAKGIEPEL